MIIKLFLYTLLLIQVSTASYSHPRIINGESTYPGQFPFAASISSGLPPIRPYRHICAGVILDRFWILSSASCILKLRGFRKSNVKVGKYFTSVDSETVQTLQIAKKIIHEDYNSELHLNDIGLILLQTPINITRRVNVARMPRYESVDGQRVEMIGWGLTSSGICGTSSEILRRAIVHIMNNKSCNTILSKQKGSFEVERSHLCTISNNTISSGHGDSGGPIVHYVHNNPFVVGILTNNLRYSSHHNLPTVSTRVRSFFDWISNKMSVNRQSIEM